MSRNLVRRPTRHPQFPVCLLVAAVLAAIVWATPAAAHEPPYTENLHRDACTFTAAQGNPWFPLWPGYVLSYEGELVEDSETIDTALEIEVLDETEVVDGVETRVVIEREQEDGELIEQSRNFFALCRETGAVWYFGEEVDIYEDGEVVSHAGAWRAGEAGAAAGIFMPGTPLAGSRFYQELAVGVAEDRSEILATDAEITVPAGTFEALHLLDTTALDAESVDHKYYAAGVGLIQDEELQLVEVTPPPCLPDNHTLCLQDGRFRVQAEWTDPELNTGDAGVNFVSDDSGELWFFRPDNVELLIKVLDGCAEFDHFWVFVAGLTNVEVDVTVTDTEEGGEPWTYHNPLGHPFSPVLDTSAFATCP